MKPNFSLDGYRELIAALLDRDYSIRGYADSEPDKRHLILRHDIDMSLESAVVLARVERELGVRSTYFVLLRSGLYNPFSGLGQSLLGELLEAGHQIGLHFDASLYAPDRRSLEAACEQECQRLEHGLGCPVEIVSFHRPAEVLIGAAGDFAGRPHAYEPRFINEMGYCTDSRGAWHHGHPLEHEAIAQGRALQMLTHPIWWDSPADEGVIARLDRLAVEQAERFREELADNCEPYRDAIHPRRDSER